MLLQGGAYRAAVLAHKSSIQDAQQKADRQRSGSLGRNPSLHALHEHEEEAEDEANEGAHSGISVSPNTPCCIAAMRLQN